VSDTACKDGYLGVSIFVHWITAILVIALFLTHEGERGSTEYAIHVGGGALVGIFLLWRVWHRIRRGMTEKPDQALVFNVASQIVIWGFLAAIVVVVVSGYLIPWSAGQSLDIFGPIAIPSPMGSHHFFHEFMEEAHEISGQLFPVLLILHVLGTAKHAFLDRDGVASRMFKSVSGGR
jgi:cytochrome b561